MNRRILLFLALTAVLVLTFALNSTTEAQGPVINLDKVDRSGVPVGLVSAVGQVASSADKQVALAEFDKQLPYSPKIRAMQKQIADLQMQLPNAKTKQDAEAILRQMNVLSDQMMSDPTYAKTVNSVTKMLTTGTGLPSGAPRIAAVATGPVNFGALQRGDIMLEKGTDLLAWIYAMTYSHAGTYDGYSNVYESNPDGVRVKSIAPWRKSGYYVGFGRDNRNSQSQVQAALNWAEGKYGTNGRTPYNYFFPDKWTDSRLYCSQLVWKIHNYLGVDVDSNNWGYWMWAVARFGGGALAIIGPGVAPDEIALSPYVTMYASGTNK